jgi:hypothetical protein
MGVRRHVTILIALAGAVAVPPGARATDWLAPAPGSARIIEASGPSRQRYHPGAIIAGADPIALATGDELILLDSHGTRILRGPGRGTISNYQSLTRLVAGNPDKRPDIAAVADAGSLVVKSAGPSSTLYPPGATLAPAGSIILGAGDQLALLDDDEARLLRGPGTFDLSPDASSGTQGRSPGTGSIGGLVGGRFGAVAGSARSDRRVRVGAVRATGTTTRAPDLWFVDTALSGPVCIVDPGTVTLWRQHPDTGQTLMLDDGQGKTVRLPWPQGASTLAWPAAIPVVAGRSYTITIDGGAPVAIRVAVLASRPGGPREIAQALLHDGCQNQLDTLVETLAAP